MRMKIIHAVRWAGRGIQTVLAVQLPLGGREWAPHAPMSSETNGCDRDARGSIGLRAS
jgi:hypothetical protein